MSKSSIADILEVQRMVNKLDKRGKLAILHDLQKQGLEPLLNVPIELGRIERMSASSENVRADEPEMPIAVHEMRLKGKTITAATVEISTGTSAKVPTTYTEGGEK